MKINYTIKDIILVIAVILVIFLGFKYIKNNKYVNKYEKTVKLNEALRDSIDFYQTKEGEFVAEKRTLQGSIGDLLEEKNGLTSQQKDLLNIVDRLNDENKKEKEIFAAARIEYQSLIDSLNSVISDVASIDTINNKISFISGNNDDFVFDLDILNVRPYPESAKPQIKFNKIDFPNTQTITFNFDKNERMDYPVSFSVLNTNKYYRAYNIESYAIEGITKENVNPTRWNKTLNFMKRNSKYFLAGGIGFAMGKTIK